MPLSYVLEDADWYPGLGCLGVQLNCYLGSEGLNNQSSNSPSVGSGPKWRNLIPGRTVFLTGCVPHHELKSTKYS